MKYFKLKFIFIFIILLFNSCLSSSKEKTNQANVTLNDEEYNNSSQEEMNNTKEAEKRLKYFNIHDTRNGIVIERYPFPATWKEHTEGEFAYTGPNDIKVYADRGMKYGYSEDPIRLQMYQAVGWHVKYPLSIDQVIEQELVATANPIGRKMTKKYPLSQIKEFDQNLDNMFFKVEQNPKQFEAMGIEWVDPDGTRWLTVLHYELEQGYNNIYWKFHASAIGASPKYFEQAKQDYLNGLLNRQINSKWIATMNQQTEFSIRKSNEAHAQRQAEFKRGVAQRQKQWEADQELRARNQGQWEASQEANARRQEHISDVILGKTNIVDPYSGERSKINHNSNYYWVNSDGKYVGTDDYRYDPNKDDFINNRTWKEYQIDGYN